VEGIADAEKLPEKGPGNIVPQLPIGTAHAGGYIQEQDKIKRPPCCLGGRGEEDRQEKQGD
jgi:hypothetical protein